MEIRHDKNFSKSQQNKPYFLLFYSYFLFKVFKVFKILLWQAHRTPEPVSVAYKVSISRNLILFLSHSTVHRLILADTIKLLHVMAAFQRYPWAQETRLVSSLLYLLLAFLVKEVSLISFQANRNNLL